MGNKVIVAGSINMDIVAFTEKHPKVGETVFGEDLKYFPGGKGANQAVATSRTGASTQMVGCIGSDAFGESLLSFLSLEGIHLQVDENADSPTGTALIVVSTITSDNTIVVIPGSNFKLNKDHIEKIKIQNGDVLVSQFEIPLTTIEAFFQKGKESGALNILNPAPARKCNSSLLKLADIIILNETELEFFSNQVVLINEKESLISAARQIKQNNEQIIVVTLGEKGVLAVLPEKYIYCEGRKVNAIDTTGAGDCFVGSLASAISKGFHIEDAIRFANIAASICVTKPGASPSMPFFNEVDAIFNENHE